ncbi:hypothetical protein [uncultured Paraglaciecola sp.]|nr:hypothetical protein [uncultured Paraglaciecola sp.]
MEEWVNSFMMSGFTGDDPSPIELAMVESRRQFVAMVVDNVSKAENVQ